MKTDTKKKEPAFRFRKTDAGRSQSSRPRSRNDCVQRSVALVCGVSFDEAYEIMAHLDCWESFYSWIISLAPVHSLGVLFKCHPFPQPRYDLARFCKEHPFGRWIIHVHEHVFAVVDGVVLDERRPRARQCVYAAWKCKRAGAREYAELKATARLMRLIEAEEKGQDDDDDYAGFDYEERLARW
jgi:hypothetical protein